MSAIDDKLTELGFPPLPELDEESESLVESYDGVDATLAACAARGWVCGWDGSDLDELAAEFELVVEEIFERAGLDLKVEGDDDGAFVQLGGERLEPVWERDDASTQDVDEPRFASNDELVEFAEAFLDLAAYVLDRQGWVLADSGDAPMIYHVAMPRRCWDALDSEMRGDLSRREARAKKRAARPPSTPKVWN